MPVSEAVKMLPPEILDNCAFTVPEATMAKCELIRDLGEDVAKYEAVWRRVAAD